VTCVNRNGKRHAVYRMIQEEMSIPWEVIVSVSGRKKVNIYIHVSNSECLPRQSCLNLQINKNCEW
jgi:hypothetical protein